MYADLPTHPHLTILVRKSAGSTDVRLYFSKYEQFPESTEIAEWMNASSMPSKSIFVCCWSCRSLTFTYFKPFSVLKYMAGPDWSESFSKPVNIGFALKALWKLVVSHLQVWWVWVRSCRWQVTARNWRRGGRMQETKEKAPIRQQPFKKVCVGVSERSTCGALLWGKVFCGLCCGTTLVDVNKIEASKCHSVPIL